jgi:microcystin-dependent protein
VTDTFLGEIRVVGFNFAPQGWALCDGQLIAIVQNTALFSLLGTQYGGDGRSTFGLPNFQGNFAVGQGQGAGLGAYTMGDSDGVASVALTQQQMAGHSHLPQASAGVGTTNNPANAVWAEARVGRVLDQVYATSGGLAPMAATALGTSGSSQPHNNLPPYLVVNFIIALTGIFPSRS